MKVIALLTVLDAHQKTILVVEDYEDTRDFLDVLIKTETSYHVLSIADGDETLQRVEELAAIQPVLFIFDFQLPAMTALHLYDRLHGIKVFEHIPAIIITAITPTSEIESAIRARGLELLLKPFDVEDLLRCIEQALQHSLQSTLPENEETPEPI